MSVTISVIVPAYNAEETIEQCINSILSQEAVELEVIVINDGSSDKTREICGTISEKDLRVKVYSQSNKGVSASRNRGIIEARGKYIAWVDADDRISPSFCRKMIDAIEKNSADMVICGYISDKNGAKESFLPDLWNENTIYPINECFADLVRKTLSHPLWNKIFVKEKIVGEFNEKYVIGEDIDFTTRYWEENHRICFINDALYYYNEQNVTSLTKSWKKIYRSIIDNCCILNSFMSKSGIAPHIMDDYFIGFIYGQVRNLRHQNRKQERELIGEIKNIVRKLKPNTCKRLLQKCLIKLNLSLIR